MWSVLYGLQDVISTIDVFASRYTRNHALLKQLEDYLVLNVACVVVMETDTNRSCKKRLQRADGSYYETTNMFLLPNLMSPAI
jgi:hypothetical protein